MTPAENDRRITDRRAGDALQATVSAAHHARKLAEERMRDAVVQVRAFEVELAKVEAERDELLAIVRRYAADDQSRIAAGCTATGRSRLYLDACAAIAKATGSRS